MVMDSSFSLATVVAAIGLSTLLSILVFKVYKRFRFRQENKVLDSSSPSSSLPSSSCKWTHDVFPSFRGEDVRKNFLSHIQKEFRRKGITLFNDNEIKRGESIGPELIQAIRRSKVAVILLSRNYASSKWCLDELAEIMKCKKDLGQIEVFAIFFEVDPSDVKKLTGEFGAIFRNTCEGKRKEDIGRWRQAFAKVATIAGYDSRNWNNEAVMIENIVAEISKRLVNSKPTRCFEGLIGMEAHIEKMKLLLSLQSEEVRVIGIWGPPGIGKTTIARFLFDQISDGFQLSGFMDIKSSYTKPTCSDDYKVKLNLVQQLLSQLTDQKDLQISRLRAAQDFLMNKKVLIIFDGVDQLEQSLAMPEAQYFGHGSRIIITTQNLRVLDAFKIDQIYQVDLPPNDEALQIFCMSAFGQSYAKDSFEDLAQQITNLTGRLPLGLKVMGSHFRGILSKQEWKRELPRLRVRLDKKIGSILKFSYDALEEEDKDLFLHIACFFVQHHIGDHTFEDVLKHRLSNVRQGLKVLVQRSLINKDSQKHYSMHDLLVQFGREIVRNLSIDEPGKRQFLVDSKEICEVLTENTGSRNIIGINFANFRIEDDRYISERAFEEMSNLQLLSINSSFSHHKRLHLPQGLKCLSSKLRILDWNYYPIKSFPSHFNTKFLVKIKLRFSKLEKLWEGIQRLGNLKFMDLSYSTNLKKLPDLSTAIKLFSLNLSSCPSVVKLPSSIGNLPNLIYLDLSKCSNLKELPSSIGNLSNLQDLDISKCSNLVELPSSFGNLTNLQNLGLSECSNLVELPSDIGNLTNLSGCIFGGGLDLSGCTSLVKIPSSIGNLQKLKWLNLQRCSKLEVLPININLGSLEELDVSGCSQLRSFPEISTNIEVLKLCGTLINEVPLFVNSWSRLTELEIPYCKNLGEFPNILNIITKLELNNTQIEEFPLWFGECCHLDRLVLNECKKLVSIPQLPGSLDSLVAENCDSLERLACSFHNLRISLRFVNCWKLNEEARDIIVQSSSSNNSTAILPGREVPEFFTYRSTTGGSIKANIEGNSWRYKVCISLVGKGDRGARDKKRRSVYCNIVDKQSGLDTVLRRLQLPLPSPLLTEHLYTFQFIEHKVKPGELFFEFKLEGDKWEIAQCGMRQL